MRREVSARVCPPLDEKVLTCTQWKRYKWNRSLGDGIEKLEDTDEEKVVEEKDDGSN
jgi:hypothetical protein